MMMAKRREDMEARAGMSDNVRVGAFVAKPTPDIAMEVARIEEPASKIELEKTSILRPANEITAEEAHTTGSMDQIPVEKLEEEPCTSYGPMSQQPGTS
jgi:hypothetical protein